MVSKEILFKELIKNGHSVENNSKVWDIANMSFLYLNDEMAKGFLKLQEHPRYKATIIDIEKQLIKNHVLDIIKCVEECKFNLIDLGCIDGTKAKLIIEAFKENKFRYCPVSVNKYLIDLSLNNVKKGNYKNITEYAPRISPDFNNLDEVGAALRNIDYNKNVYLILNSLLGGFDINDYLFRLSQSMFPGDILIIGNGIRTGERFVNIENYKHPLFNEWFIYLIKELGFKENEVEYDARFTEKRVEGIYKTKVNKIIEVGKNKIALNTGDKIIVASLYKYYANELEEFCKMYFSGVELFKDKEEEYALVICRK